MDILIPFVDSDDCMWQDVMLRARGLRYLSKEARKHFLEAMNDRFASYGLFKYWFRSVEKNYSDLDRIHLLLLQSSQVPKFLVEDDRIVIHYHDEFIPEKLRPCFNSSVIELCAMKELELSPLYILANDDMYVNERVDDGMLSVDGKPKSYIRTLPKYGDSMFQGFLENGRKLVSDYFGKECPCYDWVHLWQVYDDRFCKKVLTDNWDRILGTMTQFREDGNVNHMLCMMAQNLDGVSVHSLDFPHNGYYTTGIVPDDMELRGKKIICLNDNGSGISDTSSLLARKFKYPSSFERFSSITHGLPEPVLNRYVTYGAVNEGEYDGERNGEMFVHWYYVDRKSDSITKCEAFHMNMFRMFAIPKRVSTIHLRVAGRDNPNCAAIRAFDDMVTGYGCKLDMSFVENDAEKWEHDTFKECVEYAVETGKYVYYVHFKGVTHFNDAAMTLEPRPDKHGAKMNEIDLMYWCYLMYRGLFEQNLGLPATGPLLRDGILRAYKKADRSWSYTNTMNHYMGSFQAFDGNALRDRFIEMKLDYAGRARKIWNGNRYIVEQFLSMVFSPDEVQTLLIGSLMSYSMHSDRRFGPYLKDFDRVKAGHTRHVPTVKSKYAVITYIYGGNEVLRPVEPEAGIEYVCVTDDNTLQANGWNFVVDKLEWLSDSRSRYHYVKLHPFDYVDAEQIVIIDGSYEIHPGMLEFISGCTSDIALKPHPARANLGEEVPEWVSRRGMTGSEASMFWNIVKILGGCQETELYEFDVSIWNKTRATVAMLDMAWAILVSCAFSTDTCPSNQLAMSLLAGTLYKKLVSHINEIPAIKHAHNMVN